MKASEKTFQTGWFVESVISACLIVLVVRTRLPFMKSLPGRYLAIATVLILLVVLFLPLTPVAGIFGFERLPFSFYCWMFLIVSVYIGSAEILKQWFYRRLDSRRKG